ncbi:MAG: ribonuclease III [Chloroflexi bacterium]|nr:ribonuclease III [Chloroflexota bacterium]
MTVLRDSDDLERALGATFHDRKVLQEALTHRSYVHEQSGALASNERLEFLGDAFLGFVIADELFRLFPAVPEGDLTRLRTALVRKETLAEIAASLDLGDFLYLGRGEAREGGRRRMTNLARGLEALVGAVLVDQGYEAARAWLLKLLAPAMERLAQQGPPRDEKSRLQEMVQAEGRPSPVYRVVEAAGPDHRRTFVVEVVVGDKVLGRGTGRSKRAAEREAAQAALATLQASGPTPPV